MKNGCGTKDDASKFKLKPFFSTTPVTGENYHALLQNDVFPELRRKRKISTARGLGQPWPLRSPDLTPMGMLKARIYHSFNPQNLNDLQRWIQDEIDNISMDQLSRAVGNIRHRVDLVLEVNGGTFARLA